MTTQKATSLIDGGAAELERARFPQTVYKFARATDNAWLRVLDTGVIVAAWTLAYVAGFEGKIPPDVLARPIAFLGVPLAIQLLTNQLFGVYGPVWRYASVQEALRIVAAVCTGVLATVIALVAISQITDVQVPYITAPCVAALLMLLGCGGMRFQARLFALERQQRCAETQRMLIVGAGHTGVALSRELSADDERNVELVGFVDDDLALRGRSVRGVRVLGAIDDLEALVQEHHIDKVLVALPNIAPDRTQAIVDLALTTTAQVKVVPRTAELLDGPLVRSLREIDLADLLGRAHAPVDTSEIADCLQVATVLITGAGGSIGSEIARQVMSYGPRVLVLLDRDESLLHDVAVGELADADVVLGDIRDRARMNDIFNRYRPDVVFHAAAHKHVPILERHPTEAVQTNLLATWSLAETAAKYGCERFVHISTDKAASPCSVMGATKRAAELVVFEVGRQHNLPFTAVRFGNVLGSRGSVVPTFLRQILDGGPVTVTDPEMTRYFMTIPEAVSLVLQAGAMAHEEKAYLLDMGSPVSILALARQMIRLAGLRPDEDIEIKIVGARAGERLHEQLSDDAEAIEPTSHPSIFSLQQRSPGDPAELFFFLDLLERKCSEAADGEVTSLLEQLLRHCGVECNLGNELTGVPAALPPRQPAADRRVDRPRPLTKKPALLGGIPTFDPSLPFGRPNRPDLERMIKRLEPSVRQGALTNGPLVRELEDRVRARLGVDEVVAVSSCTSGLMLTVQALARHHGGAVVLPSFTFSATGHAVLWNGLEPRFAECDPATFQLDLDDAEHLLAGASLLIATHLFGAPCDPDGVEALASSFGIPVLFDAADAFGATADGRPIGNFGDAEVFSLTPTKALVAGEGGLITTHDPSLANTLRMGRDYGNPGNYDTQFAGLNARMSEFHAAVALESLEIFDALLERRRDIADRYHTMLSTVPGVTFQRIPDGDSSTYKDFTISIDAEAFGLTRDQVVLALEADGVETRRYFDPPVHQQTAYKHLAPVCRPVTDAVAASVLSLPIYPDLDDDQIDAVAETVASIQRHAVELDDCVPTVDPTAAAWPARAR